MRGDESRAGAGERTGGRRGRRRAGAHERARGDRGRRAPPRPGRAAPRRRARLLAALDAAGVPVAAVTVSRPSLDDVYLHHTGRDFRSDDQAGNVSVVAQTLYLFVRLMREPGPPADLDFADPDPADVLAAALQPALPARRGAPGFGTDSYIDFLDAGHRGDDRVLLRNVRGDGDDRGPRPRRRRALPATPAHRGAIVFARVLQSAATARCRPSSSSSSGSRSAR